MNINNYIKCAFSYGFIRKYLYTKDVKYRETIDDKIIERPILYADYFFSSVYSGLFCMITPYLFIYGDIRFLELKMRNIKIKDEFKDYKKINFIDLINNLHIYTDYSS